MTTTQEAARAAIFLPKTVAHEYISEGIFEALNNLISSETILEEYTALNAIALASGKIRIHGKEYARFHQNGPRERSAAALSMLGFQHTLYGDALTSMSLKEEPEVGPKISWHFVFKPEEKHAYVCPDPMLGYTEVEMSDLINDPYFCDLKTKVVDTLLNHFRLRPGGAVIQLS